MMPALSERNEAWVQLAALLGADKIATVAS